MSLRLLVTVSVSSCVVVCMRYKSGTLHVNFNLNFVDALHYAISAKPKRIHCVDMNPCQVRVFGVYPSRLVAYTFSTFVSRVTYSN